MARISLNDRQRRIIRLAQDWGINLPPAPTRLDRPAQLPSYRTPADDQTAEELLQRHAHEISQIRPKSGLSRAFSSSNLKKGKNWDPTVVLHVLQSWINQDGSPGVAEALLGKLAAAGVELPGMQKPKSGLLNRRRSLESFVDRTKLLRSAVERDQVETVQVLLPHADPLALDGSLPVAIRRGNTAMVELLLRFGANVSQTAEGQDAFRQACSAFAGPEIVRLVLQSDGRPSPELASQSMVDAARAGLLETVLHLSRSIADGNHNQAQALQHAVGLGLRDIAIAIVMGNKPPQGQGLSQAFRILDVSTTHSPSMKLEIGELLLCAGAEGDVLAQALQNACEAQFYEMASLLAGYGVSIEYNDAAVVKTAIQKGQLDLVRSLLSESATLNPALASSCVALIPHQATDKDRYLLLDLLLRKGAKGTPINEKLIDATRAGDSHTVDLLLKPFFPERNNRATPPVNGAQGAPHRLRHEVASPDYKDGEALRTAVLRVDFVITRKILASQPSGETLSTVFPLTKNLSASDRYEMVDLFLKGALSGPPLHAALQDAISQDTSTRDENLIRLLLNFNADINYNHGEGLQAVIMQHDLPLLEFLMQRAAPQTAAARVPGIMKVDNRQLRYKMTALMLEVGAAVGVEEVSAALLLTLQERPVDMELLRLLLQRGNARVNSTDHSIIAQAIRNPDPKVLELILTHGKPSVETISTGLNEIASLPSTDGKASKLRATLAKSNRRENVDRLLVTEVQTLTEAGSSLPSFAALKQLLDAGADPNAYQAAALCRAVEVADSPITDMLLGCDKVPNPAALGVALRLALKIVDPMDRFSFTKKLVTSGASPAEANEALLYAIKAYPDDQPLIEVLANVADTSGGEAMALSVAKESAEALSLLLTRSKSTAQSRDTALQKVLSIRDRAKRRRMCQDLLKNGVSREVTSKALQVAARDGDRELGDLLIAHGASISSNNGQAIIEACRGGSGEVLEVLLRAAGNTDKTILHKGFQAATEIGDLNKRAVVFEKLLKKGVTGEPVDAQLLSAARYGDGGHQVLRVLLEGGADPNYSNGEAIVAATSTAHLRNLELLLGLWDQERRQRKPSHPTLIRALKASLILNRETRLEIIRSLFKAGMPATDDVHIALNQAVNEEAPDEKLVELLLDHGASPTANDCKTLIDVVRRTAAPCLGLVLRKPISQEDINRTFSLSFTPDNFDMWFSESGMKTAEKLLDAGAQGYALSEMLVQVMKGCDTETAPLADQFIDILVSHGPDVNFNDGEALQQAASLAHVPWVRKLLACRPSSRSLSFAFHHIFDSPLDEADALALFELFTGYRDGETSVDVMALAPGAEPVLVKAITQYPRSTILAKTLLDAGYYHDQATRHKIFDDVDEDEEMTLLTWAIAQPQKKVSSAVIELLLERGANVNVATNLSRTTPLMLAIANRRPDLAKELLLEGADVDVTDYLGRTPLSLATEIGGDLAIQMMGSLLAAEPSLNDGSLHNAARELNLAAVKVLVQAGHDPDFPSTYHDGRSALGEVCLRASDSKEMTLQQEKTMQKVMTLLVDSGADLEIKSRGKPLLHLCFEAKDPVATTRVFLKAVMWKYVNKPFNQYTDGQFVYSPTTYIARVLKPSDHQEQLLDLLKANRGVDVYYATEGPQPEGAVGLPNDMLVQERQRKARVQQLEEESEDFARALARRRESTNLESQIYAQKAQMEDQRRQRLHAQDIQEMRTRAQLEESLGHTTHQRRVNEQRQLGDAATARIRANAAAEIDAEDARQRKMIEWESRANVERVESARALGAVRVSEREELDRLERSADDRLSKRLEQQRKLIEGQERLAKRLANGATNGSPVDPRRQIGFVSEELS